MNLSQKIKKIFQKKPKVIVVLGQTATGKSDFTVELAKRFDGEVISADSRQVYRGMDLGSGKITKGEMQGVPHHLLDVVSPQETFSVADFQKLGKGAIEDILARGKVPIVCGGTGFYIDALVHEMDFPAVPPNEELRKELSEKSLEELQEMYWSLQTNGRHSGLTLLSLSKKSSVKDKKITKPRFRISYFQNKFAMANLLRKYTFRNDKMYGNIDIQNPVRLIRAIEIIQALGYLPEVKKKHPYDVLFIGLTLPKEKLDKRIYQRIVKRLNQGMLDEAQKLLQEGVSHERLQALGLEYRYMSKHLLGELSYEEMIDELYRATVRFAKRQKTWFKRNKNIHWFSSAFFTKNADTQKTTKLTQNDPESAKEKIFSLVKKFLKK